MKRFWPWKRIAELEAQVHQLQSDLHREQAFHENTKIERKKLQDEAAKNSGHMEKMLQIIALKGGII